MANYRMGILINGKPMAPPPPPVIKEEPKPENKSTTVDTYKRPKVINKEK